MAEPIRVLQCMGLMNRGGAENLVMNIYRNIDRGKVQFDFVVHRKQKSAFDDEIYNLGGRIFKVPRYVVANHFIYTRAWNDLFKNHTNEWSIIHGHMFTTAAIYLSIAKKYGLITIAHSHSVSSGSGILSGLRDILHYPIRYNRDYYFACSQAAGKWLFGNKVSQNDNFYLLFNAFDIEKFKYNNVVRKAMRKKLGADDKFIIGHIGRFQREKNHDFIIDVFKAVHDIKDNTLLMLIGDGEKHKDIEKKVRAYGLKDKVIFTGVRSDVPELLQAMDVFLFPSHFEGLGMAVVEAQAAGLPTLVADTIPEEAYVTDLIEKESLKSPADTWANRILKYTAGYDRIDTSEQIKSKGYDISETAKWLEEFYLKAHERLLSTKDY